MVIFFAAYLHLLKHPAFAVRTIPATFLDNWISFHPTALPVYVSLWLYVSVPAALMTTRSEIIGYGMRMAVPCVVGFAVFYLWPNAISPPDIDWDNYPSVAFLKRVDTVGNAFPSLHVATAVFSALWLHWRMRQLRMGMTLQIINAVWCIAIAYSTLAIKQHAALDVIAGATLGIVSAWATGLKTNAITHAR